MIVSSALMIWKGLMVATGSESPIVVVLRYVSGVNLAFLLFHQSVYFIFHHLIIEILNGKIIKNNFTWLFQVQGQQFFSQLNKEERRN